MAKRVAPIKKAVDRRYDAPPVLEALCEINFTESHWDATIPGVFYERVRHEYPGKEQAEQLTFELSLAPGVIGAGTMPMTPRTRFSRPDKSQMIQLGLDLLVVNQLRPYPRYEDWRPVVERMLVLYRELARPAGINQLGLRYINRIEIPSARTEGQVKEISQSWSVKLEDYFRVYPEVPKELGSAHGNFALQINMVPVRANHRLTMTLASAPAEAPKLAYLLDLYDIAVIGGRASFDDVLRLLDEAHENVEHTFENVITDKSRELFKGSNNG